MQSSLSRTILVQRTWNGTETHRLWTADWWSYNSKLCLCHKRYISRHSHNCDGMTIR